MAKSHLAAPLLLVVMAGCSEPTQTKVPTRIATASTTTATVGSEITDAQAQSRLEILLSSYEADREAYEDAMAKRAEAKALLAGAEEKLEKLRQEDRRSQSLQKNAPGPHRMVTRWMLCTSAKRVTRSRS